MTLRFCLPLLLAGSLAAQVTPPVYVPANIYTNAGTTGTTLHKLAKLSAANTVIRMATTDTDGALGICTANCSTAGKSTIQWGGTIGCAFDGATTLGHYVTISASVAGDCADAGPTPPTSSQVIGIVLTTNGSAGNYNVNMQLRGPVPAGTGGTVTSIILAGTANEITVTGTCTVTTTGTCTFSVPSDFRLPGTINKLTLTQPAIGATVTILDGKTITVNKTLTFDGTDGVTITFPASSATVATLGLTNTFTGRQDAGGAASTAPNKVGTSLPGTCTVGDTYYKSDATAGANVYGCTATNTWTVQGGSGGGGTGVSVCPALSGSGTAYTCTSSPTITLTAGVTIALNVDVNSLGSATLNVDGGGAVAIYKNGGVDVNAVNDLVPGQWALLTYDGAHWQMQSQLGVVYPPAFGTWTQTVFPAGSSGDSTYGPLYISPAQANYMMITRSQPSTPYTIDYAFDRTIAGTGSFFFVGWRESATSKTSFMYFGQPGYGCQNNTSNTSFSSAGCGGISLSGNSIDRRQYVRLQNTGALLRCYISPDGQHWNQLGSDVAVNGFFTTAPDQELYGGFTTNATGNSPANSSTMLQRYVH